MEPGEKSNKKKLKLDWGLLMPGNDDEPPPMLIVKSEPQQLRKPPSAFDGDDDDDDDDQPREAFSYQQYSDWKLEDEIKRNKRLIDQGIHDKLPDNGKKIRDRLKVLEEERERREHLHAQKGADRSEKPAKSTTSKTFGSSDHSEQEDRLPQATCQSVFGVCFSRKMEENADCRIVEVFPNLNHSDHQKSRCNGDFSQRRRDKELSSPRHLNSRCPRNPSLSGCQLSFSNRDKKGRSSSIYVVCDHDDDLPSHVVAKKKAAEPLTSNDSRRRKGQTVVLLDEEEPLPVDTSEQEAKLSNCKKEAKIYYPSRDDPQSVEICFADIDNLAPEALLTSPIMNFYIRYLQLQASPSNRAIFDCHFFNTYFYKKLKEAVSYKGSDKDAFFIKFRRWWKGVNIFQKAYVLIPIHEILHWSLVIICIPDKEDQSGPIVLHLDSLGLHSSRGVFDNIRRYLREEWNYLRQEVAPSDLPIADNIWKNLSRRIDERIIAVPQQKNDYDCGLFVLFFMERFIEEAPERLKKKDLAMFGKKWFRPEEASGLRVKIRNLLIEQFENASESSVDSVSVS